MAFPAFLGRPAQLSLAAAAEDLSAGRGALLRLHAGTIDGGASQYFGPGWPPSQNVDCTMEQRRFHRAIGQSAAAGLRQQPLDVDYRLLLDRATRARSLDKVVDYLIRTYPQRFGKNHLARKDVEEFARDCREIGLRLGASTELGWTRIATIATHLGIGFLDDARFSRRGLSYARIGHDSQGGKILTVGRECAKPVIAVRNRLTDDAVRREVQKRHAVEWPALEDLLGLLDRIDPDCRQIWGEDALIDWVRQFLAAPRPFESFGRSLTVQLATAYCHGNYFRHDPSLAYCHALAAPSLDDYDQAIAAAFESEFRKS